MDRNHRGALLASRLFDNSICMLSSQVSQRRVIKWPNAALTSHADRQDIEPWADLKGNGEAGVAPLQAEISDRSVANLSIWFHLSGRDLSQFLNYYLH